MTKEALDTQQALDYLQSLKTPSEAFKDEELEIELPKPVLSIVAICSEGDKELLSKWIPHLPKDKRVELVVLFNKQSETYSEKVITNEYSLKIIEHTFNELDFSDLRNRAKKYATGKWILSLDIDEYLPSFLVDELLTYLDTDLKEDGYLINIANNDTNIVSIMHKAVRLFKNVDYVDWYGFVHEVPDNLVNVKPLSITLIHNGYNIPSIEGKVKRNLPLLIKQLATMECDIEETKYKFYLQYLKNTLDTLIQ